MAGLENRADDLRVVIKIKAGGLASATKKAAAALGDATCATPFHGIYRYGDQLVEVMRRSDESELEQVSVNGSRGILVIARAHQDALEHALDEVCSFVRFDARRDEWVPTDVPAKLARRLLAKATKWLKIPILTGIVEAPTLRPDGTVLDQPGYDPHTGILFDAGGMDFPVVPDSPTEEDALLALEQFTELVRDFPAVDQASVSVAISGIITPLVRHACRAVPLHAITAPKMASGKTLLASLAGYVLTGRSPRMMSQAENSNEERKRLLAVLMEGASLVVIDNIEHPLKSDALCTILTEPYYTGRVLGVSQTVTVPSRATFFATGNNLVLVGDLTTRALGCALDPKCERPEERTFDINLHQAVPKRRAKLVVAALTIVRAYLTAGEPKPNVPHFARFEDWCRFVRYPLIWLGMADPCDGRARIEGRDPVREQLVALLTAWYDVFGSEPVKVGDALKKVTPGPDFDEPTPKAEACRVLYEIFVELGSRRGKVSPTAIGRFITSYEDRIEGGLRFEKGGKASGAVLWRVRSMDDHSHIPSQNEAGEFGEVVPFGSGSHNAGASTISKSGIIIIKKGRKSPQGQGDHGPTAPAAAHEEPADKTKPGPDENLADQV